MKILITGGAGFLGSHLARRLSKSNNIRVTDKISSSPYLTSQEYQGYKFQSCDIRDKRSLSQILSPDLDLVIHCAANVNTQTRNGYPVGMFDTNVTATLQLVEAMIHKGVKNLIFCSSMTVYDAKNKSPVREDSLLHPMHFYGLSKKWAEEALLNYANQNPINILIFRYPGLYGHPRNSGYIFNTIKSCLKNEGILINTRGLKFWEPLYIEDAVTMTEKVLVSWDWNSKYEIVNCSYGEEIDFVETASKIKKMTNSSSNLNSKEPLDYAKFYLDNSKLRQMIDFNFSFEKSLNNFIENYKDWFVK